jgi:prepilin-type N-terminal cleavage/methylation domain-containing protein
MPLPVFARRGARWKSFTLIELLTVIAIIAILAALTLAAAEAVMAHAARARTTNEIQAISTALESYKNDNGIYPAADTFPGGTNDYSADDVGTTTNYEGGSMLLYQALSGKTNYADVPVAGIKAYLNFKIGQLVNTTAGSGNTYIQDPFGYSYGYYTGDVPVAAAGQTTLTQQFPPVNGTGLFDLWSTGGSIKTTSGGYTNTWIMNWNPQ